jgi:hypothetical protein
MNVDSNIQFAGAKRLNLATGQVTDGAPSGSRFADRGVPSTVLYSNLTAPSAVVGGFSLAANTSQFGDRLGLTSALGPLDEFACTIWSGTGTGTGTIFGGTLNVTFSRASDNSLIGQLNIPLDPIFGDEGLASGFYTIVDVTGIALTQNITFDTNDIIVRQRIDGADGGRAGIVLFNPIAVGTSPQTLWLDGPGAPAGFYNLGNPPIQSNPGYFLFVPSPGTAALLGLGGLVATRRRR